MAKILITYVVELLLGLFLLTQVVIPIFVPERKFFWLFRDKKPKEDPKKKEEIY